MALRICKLLLALLGFAVLCTGLVPSSRDSPGDYHLSRFAARQDEGETLTCVASCDVSTCGGAFCPFAALADRSALEARYLLDGLAGANGSLFSRAIWKRAPTFGTTPSVDDINAYLPKVHQGEEGTEFGTPLPLANRVPLDERAVSQQKRFGDQAFQIMSGGLHGCTVVVLISKRSVWAAHYWESYSHGEPNEDKVPNEAFNDRVIRQFKGEKVNTPAPSTSRTGYIPPKGPAINPDEFNGDDDEPQLFTLSPYADGSLTKLKYQNRLGVIHREIRRHLGLRKLTWIKKGYSRLNYSYNRQTGQNEGPDAALVNTQARGMALFQYSPNAFGNGEKGWRLFLEANYMEMRVQ